MPFSEPAVYYRRSNLTRAEKAEQLRVIYGVPKEDEMEKLTAEEAQKLRALLAQHDTEQSPVKTTDLNNPPHVPYRHQEFPKMVYDLENSKPGSLVTMVVRSPDELADAIADGWDEDAPAFGDGADERLDGKYANEAARVDAVIEESKPRNKGGRPRKVVEVAA